MDYIDYKIFMVKNWKRNKQLHKERLKAIISSPTNRIDNKPSEYQLKAPCMQRKDKKNLELISSNLKHYNNIREIYNKNNLKEVKGQIDRMSIASKTSSKKNKHELEDQNWKIYNKLMLVKPQLSSRKWEEDFQRSSSYKKLISKPHLEKKLPEIKSESMSKRRLIDSYSLLSF
jgi:hypothetical protein